ncbi:hypothetical protein [Calidifontibacillus erzurumensis]|uniref:hypothetical protein n=1 Tax=Calidifontibacillus erzurumensis TaxID=2741433 RepID=UPI0035B50FB9
MNMMPGLAKTETNIKLPFSFIIYSLVAFSASQIILAFSGDFMANGAFRIPTLWMVAHFLLLGWAVMVAMGAMYQLVPVAFLTPIWNETFGFIQFAVTAIGITSFALSLAFFPKLTMVASLLTVFGILMFLFQMAMTMKKQAEKNIMTLFVGTALGCLLLTILLGMVLAASVSGHLPLSNHLAVLKSHILLGVAGWFTLLIFGFSYKMVPMFSLSHGFSMKLSKPIYIIYMIGLLSAIISFWTNITPAFQLGMLLLFVSFTMFVSNMREIINKRLKKNLDKPFIFSLIAIIIGWIIHLVAFIASFISMSPFVFGVIIYLYILGWIVFSIMGYLYKIVPFLWWTHKYSKEMGKPNVPTLKQLMNEKLGVILFIISLQCFLGFVVAFSYKLSSFYTIIQCIFAITAVVFSSTVVNILRK